MKKTIDSIAGRIFAIWAILIFVITMLLFLIPFLLFCYFQQDPLKTRRFIRYSRVWMGIFLPLIGCPLRRKGLEHFLPGENYIVVCNHNSLMDVPISSPSIPGGNKTIAKVEMARIPIFGLMYRTGSVLVDRKSENSRKESFDKMKAVLKMGLHMCIYPEGTRNKSDQPLKSFHDGAFRLAIATGKPIMPAVIFNTRNVLPANRSFYLMPKRMHIHFLKPVRIGEEDSAQSMKEKVYRLMEKYLINHSDDKSIT